MNVAITLLTMKLWRPLAEQGNPAAQLKLC